MRKPICTLKEVADPKPGQHYAKQTVEFYNLLFSAGVPAELHLYGHGDHAGAISERGGIPFGTWHVRFLRHHEDRGATLGVPGRSAEQDRRPSAEWFRNPAEERGPLAPRSSWWMA